MPKVHTVNIILPMGLMEHMVEHKERMEDITTMELMEDHPMLQDRIPILPRITADS